MTEKFVRTLSLVARAPDAPRRGLNRTLRVIGLAVAARGRALDLLLIETDGGDHNRLIDTERQPLAGGLLSAAIVDRVLVFMGDRALQPFAVDLIAIASGGPIESALAIEHRTGVTTVLAGASGERPWSQSRAERAAFAAVDDYCASQHIVSAVAEGLVVG